MGPNSVLVADGNTTYFYCLANKERSSTKIRMDCGIADKTCVLVSIPPALLLPQPPKILFVFLGFEAIAAFRSVALSLL